MDLKREDLKVTKGEIDRFKVLMGFSPECFLVNGAGQFADIIAVKATYVVLCTLDKGDVLSVPKANILDVNWNPMGEHYNIWDL